MLVIFKNALFLSLFFGIIHGLYSSAEESKVDQAHEWPHHRGDPALQGLSNAALGNRIFITMGI